MSAKPFMKKCGSFWCICGTHFIQIHMCTQTYREKGVVEAGKVLRELDDKRP